MTSRGDVKSRRSHVVFPYLVAPAEALVSFDVFLSSVIFRPRVPSAFIAWSVGQSRNRTNWQLTTVKRLRNVLRLITEFALEERRDVESVDPDGQNFVFDGCSGLFIFDEARFSDSEW